MKRFTLSALALVLAAPAFAGGVVEPVEPPMIVPMQDPGTDWTGFYAGAQIESIIDGTASSPTGPGDADLEGTLYGVFGGYRHDFGGFVLGGEVDLMFGSGEVGAPQAPPPTNGLPVGSTDVDYDSLLRVGVEAGADLGRVFAYGTAGYAAVTLSAQGNEEDGTGYFYGIGMDFLATENVTIGAELLQHRFDDFDGGANIEIDALTLGVNVAYRF